MLTLIWAYQYTYKLQNHFQYDPNDNQQHICFDITLIFH